MYLKFAHANIDFEGISEGGIRTSISIPRYSLLFDIGGIPHEKIHMENVLVTHGHLDHAAGIPYYISQRSLQKLKAPNIYVNEAMYENTKKIIELYSEIEGFSYNYNLISTPTNKEFSLTANTFFKAYQTTHRIPSQGYTIFEKVKKIKSEYASLSSAEIVQLKSKGENLTEEKSLPLVSFSGDTQIEYVLEHKDVRESKILFLECTYVDDDRNVERARAWGHTHLDEIMAHAKEFKNEKIVLIHFSKRYKHSYIKDMIRKKTPESLKGRIHCFLP
ncbi:MAG TPA: MBL fold metallo-hydrolase [Leptospiraceae bacterium]|nr:MBL fold metallo-hydrolase [Leptospiraceae bacterium]HMW03586.1 MBL fold metallo-hydrolase [Leptospiraceae bacterium]HMX32327.1 MBL fold metallo-hydrolase [Leptospiraceae bacterium]HMY29493.1 MBL fold metallo-hydrolase [Leptospiraceae bacterium]HMZ63586.1 MBL fold metallo-hydrolase [Leptospiraceae bacterium]